MANDLTYIDAHCHLADPRFDGLDATRAQIIDRAKQRGISYFIQGGVDPNDWDRQLEIKRQFSNSVLPVFGLHPWWVSKNDRTSIDHALRLLPDYLEKACALGELGLDYSDKISPSSHELQAYAFSSQLEMAKFTGKPLVLHIVHAHDLAIDLIKNASLSCSGIVHAFSGGSELAARYLDLGFLISVGGQITRKGFEKLKRAVVKLPLEKIVIESDSPDQLSEPGFIWEVAQTVAALQGVDAPTVLAQSACNLKKAFFKDV